MARALVIALILLFANSAHAQFDAAPSAVDSIKERAQRGDPEAQFNLASFYDKGDVLYGVTQDFAEASRWYTRAAMQGHALAALGLCRLFDQGFGVPQNYAEASRWCRKAAEAGNAAAQFATAEYYYEGKGIRRDISQAIAWYKEAALQGNYAAQYNIADIYEQGRGMGQNFAEAAHWFRKAAEQGDAQAQYNLGLLFGEGRGVTKSFGEAYFWLILASTSGEKQSSDARDKISASLSGKEIASIQQRAHQWHAVRSPFPANSQDVVFSDGYYHVNFELPVN